MHPPVTLSGRSISGCQGERSALVGVHSKAAARRNGNSPSPKGGSEKGDPINRSLKVTFKVTFKSLKNNNFPGSPLGDSAQRGRGSASPGGARRLRETHRRHMHLRASTPSGALTLGSDQNTICSCFSGRRRHNTRSAFSLGVDNIVTPEGEREASEGALLSGVEPVK